MIKRLINSICWLKNYIRVIKFKCYGVHCNQIYINGRVIINGNPRKLYIGDGSSINEGVFFQTMNKIIIGENVHISPYSQFYTGQLLLSRTDRKNHQHEPIIIEDNVWIAANVIVASGITIGKNSVIGAHSFVNRDIAPNSLAYGVPAVVHRMLS